MAAWVSNAVSTLWLHESYTGPTAHVIMQAFRVSHVHMHGMYSTGSAQGNVLKPVPQHPLEPELDFKRGLWNRYFPGGHAMSMRSIDPGRRRGSRGEEQPPWWGLGRSPRSQR